MRFTVDRIDHIVLNVTDVDIAAAWYQRVLGMKTESMGEGRAALYFGQQKIHLDAAGGAMAMNGDGGPWPQPGQPLMRRLEHSADEYHESHEHERRAHEPE